MSDRPNMRYILEELAERLEEDAGYEPASVATDMTEGDVCSVFQDDTVLLYQLAAWLNDPNSPERRVALKEMGFDWSEK